MSESAGAPASTPLVVVLARSTLDGELLVAWLRRQGLDAQVVGSSPPEGGLGSAVLLVDGDADRLGVRRVVQQWTATGRSALVLARDGEHEDRPVTAELGRLVHVMRRPVTPSQLREALDRVLHGRAPRPLPRPTPPAGLTTRELEVLTRLAVGDSNHQAAQALGISPHTVRTHVQNLLAKLGAEHRLAAVAAARRCGALPGPGELVGAGPR